MKSIRTLIVTLVVVMAAVLVVPTFAQDSIATPTAPTTSSGTHHRPSAAGIGSHVTSLTLTVTQDQINTRLANRPGDRLKDLSITLGNNQITVSFTTNGKQNAGVGQAIVAVVTPAAVDGKVTWTLNSLTIDGKAATQDQTDKLKERVTSLIGKFDQRERHFLVDSVTVDSTAIMITLSRKANA